ncbi:MAG: hypothetical protein N3D74_04545 [Caldisericia bacterium]|nr:hypothetical protein [Caldisericia bacterium]
MKRLEIIFKKNENEFITKDNEGNFIVFREDEIKVFRSFEEAKEFLFNKNE